MNTRPKDLWIAVPTYWTHPAGELGENKTVFDHPTPLNQEGTLARTLESFTRLNGRFKVIIVAAGTSPAIGGRVHRRVAELIQPFARRLELYLASPANLDGLNQALSDPILKLDSYGSIRNVQLIVPFALGCDAVAGIDDDEIVPDVDFMTKVARIGQSRADGQVIGGMAGPYYDARGQYAIEGAEELADCPNIFLKKNFFMNRAIARGMTQAEADGLIRSNVAFGGNMVMSRLNIARTCHDPYIARGEDYDYVINAAMDGIYYYFQPAMRITHLPPDSTGSQAADKQSKLLADISRFIYMQEKMRYHRQYFPQEAFDPSYLQPYPGPYLDPAVDLADEAVRSLDEKYPDFRRTNRPEDYAANALDMARIKAREFFEYRGRWRSVLDSLDKNDGFRAACGALKVD